ncbi:DUF3108 domain-containing protein [Arenibacter sp. GZD96]|uniref:DUF3108 domain-containing protein n=1 Tax=Aurantibrevibacter litoralis TaxID=3106030 RepID=UPI002AFE117B|nr:DUF3108 domain-containing protein [Arenibacter sp. GZD-96]MEA1787241.1 DUF3108 domain-containing protein [Arenibacter sp. GZD-96]
MERIGLLFFALFTINGQVSKPTSYLDDLKAEEIPVAFQPGEWLQFRIHYGFLNASYATLHVKTTHIDTIPVYHVVGRGQTTGFASIFFKVDDTYESYFGQKDGKPYKFIRKINEGGYTKDVEINFDHQNDVAIIKDHKKNKVHNLSIQEDVQDLVSAFYHIRNNFRAEDLVEGKSIELNMLYDDDGLFRFRLKYLGKEILKTKYGKVECLKFRPYVQSGRVFKEQESLSLWVSNDLNKIPIRIKADLAVGSIKADLEGYNGLKNQFKIIMD